jgi:translation initiation factor 3 subunit G
MTSLVDSETNLKPLPPNEEIGPDENGIKIYIKYYRNEEGKTVKQTRTVRVEKRIVRMKRSVWERRQWAKFGECAGKPPGPEPAVTYQSPEIIKLDLSGSHRSQTSQTDTLLSVGNTAIKCRCCGESGHWTSKCPKRDQNDTEPLQTSTARPTAPTGKYVPPNQRPGAKLRRPEDKNTVRVTNLPQDVEEDDLGELFGAIGRTQRIFLARDYDTRESRGFAFITYMRHTDAEVAIEKLNGHGYSNMILEVDWAKPREE